VPSDLEDILQQFVPKRLYDELRRDYDRLLVRLGRMEEQLLMLSEYRLEPEEATEVIDRKIRRAERSGRRRARDLSRHPEEHGAEEREPRQRDEAEHEPGEREPQPRRAPERERERERRGAWNREPRRRADSDTGLDDSLAEESTDELIRRLRLRYREISRLRDRLRDEEE